MCALRSAPCALRPALCLMCSVVSVQVFRPEAILFEHRHADGTWSFPVRAGENFNSVNQTLHDAGYVTLRCSCCLPAACGGGGGICSHPAAPSTPRCLLACLPAVAAVAGGAGTAPAMLALTHPSLAAAIRQCGWT